MKPKQENESLANQALEAEYKHVRALLRTLFTAEQVIHDGKCTFIRTISCNNTGPRPVTDVYISGDPKPLNPAQIKIIE